MTALRVEACSLQGVGVRYWSHPHSTLLAESYIQLSWFSLLDEIYTSSHHADSQPRHFRTVIGWVYIFKENFLRFVWLGLITLMFKEAYLTLEAAYPSILTYFCLFAVLPIVFVSSFPFKNNEFDANDGLMPYNYYNKEPITHIVSKMSPRT